jgi:hypothetical protein
VEIWCESCVRDLLVSLCWSGALTRGAEGFGQSPRDEESAGNIINALVHLGVRRKTARDLCATCQTARRINLGRARASAERPAAASSSLFTQFGREKEQTRCGWHYFGSALINT